MKKLLLLALVATTMIFTSCNKEYNITVMPNDPSMGNTSGSGSYLKGTVIEISALPNSGCGFVKWDDGNTNNPRRITVNKNETFTAVFKKDNDTDIPVFNNTVIIDGVERPIQNVLMDESDFNDNMYEIIIFLSDIEGFKIWANKLYHDGRTIDLTRKEPEHDGWYWSVEGYINGDLIFDTYGEPNTGYPVFISGTLYVKHTGTSNGNPVFEIRIENGEVIATGDYGDGLLHTIELNYKGEIGFSEF